jgi:thiamine biosynthesis protein ThiC
MTQLEQARAGVITEAMQSVADTEKVDVELLRTRVAEGTVVIPLNNLHPEINNINPVGIGRGLSIKVNANIGTSGDEVDLEEELLKLQVATEAKADTIMGRYYYGFEHRRGHKKSPWGYYEAIVCACGYRSDLSGRGGCCSSPGWDYSHDP